MGGSGSRDSFLNGRLQIRQDTRGYRFSIDAVLLAGHINPKPNSRLVDLGTGCGIIPLMIGSRCKHVEIFAVEIQRRLSELAEANVGANGMSGRIHILCKDLRNLEKSDMAGPVNWVVSNPPYRKAGSGRINPDRQKALAMHEIMATLQDVVHAAAKMLDRRGRFSVIYPAERTATLLTRLRDNRLEPKRLRMVHSTAGGEAVRVLVEAVKNGREGVSVLAPLVVYASDGTYTPEVDRLLGNQTCGTN